MAFWAFVAGVVFGFGVLNLVLSGGLLRGRKIAAVAAAFDVGFYGVATHVFTGHFDVGEVLPV